MYHQLLLQGRVQFIYPGVTEMNEMTVDNVHDKMHNFNMTKHMKTLGTQSNPGLHAFSLSRNRAATLRLTLPSSDSLCQAVRKGLTQTIDALKGAMKA